MALPPSCGMLPAPAQPLWTACPLGHTPAGLSAWDKHVGYRNLRMHPVLHPPPSSPPPKQERAAQQVWLPGEPDRSQLTAAGPASVAQQAQQAQQESAVPSLLHCCQAALGRSLAPGSVCDVLQDCLAPVVDGLRRWGGWLAGALGRVVRWVGQLVSGWACTPCAPQHSVLCKHGPPAWQPGGV